MRGSLVGEYRDGFEVWGGDVWVCTAIEACPGIALARTD